MQKLVSCACLIELLVNGRKQIDVVHLIHAFQLTESVPPVPLLKTYLKDLRRNSKGKGENRSDVSGGQVQCGLTKKSEFVIRIITDEMFSKCRKM